MRIQWLWYNGFLKPALEIDSNECEGLFSPFPLEAGFFVSCSHAQAELVSSSRERFVTWISGLKLFTVEHIQASLYFLLSLIRYWQSDGLKYLCPNGSFFFALFSIPSASDTWPPGICCVFSVQRLPARRQSPGGHAWPEQARWLLTQSSRWSFSQKFGWNGFFDRINHTNSRSVMCRHRKEQH